MAFLISIFTPVNFGGVRPSSTFTGSETAANLNSSNANAVTVKAKWKSNCTGDCSEIDVAVNGYVDYTYTGSVKGVVLKNAGRYKLEVWGAQGGTSSKQPGGYGGYAFGNIQKSSNDVIYIVVGGTTTTYQGTFFSLLLHEREGAGGIPTESPCGLQQSHQLH